MKSFKEYKERQEAKKFFRQNNNIYLSNEELVLLLFKGLISAIIIGIIHGMIIQLVGIDFSLFYVVVGLLIANVLTTSVNKATKQIGLLSALFTFIAYYVTQITLLIAFVPFTRALSFAFISIISSDLLSLIFYIIGIVVAYLQGSENKFM